MFDMMKRHEVQVLRRAGVAQEQVAKLTGVSHDQDCARRPEKADRFGSAPPSRTAAGNPLLDSTAGGHVRRSGVTDALAAIATELAVVLAGATVTMEQRRRWHALLSGEGADPNIGRLTLKRGWAC